MKKPILFTLLLIFVFSLSVFAQDDERFSSTRLSNLSDQLKRQTVDLVDQTSEDLRRNTANTRSDIEAAFVAAQLDASAGLFQQMVQDRKRAAELRDAASILTDLSRRAPTYGSNNSLWRNVQNAVNDINRELGGNNGGGNNGGDNNPVVGRAFWRGTVDDRIQIELTSGKLRVRTLSGREYPEGNYSFTANLPTRRVSVEVEKKKGRGEVRVIQQPSRDNGYTAIVEVYDSGGGAKEYELEIFWR